MKDLLTPEILTMSSLEIAKLVGKMHKHVIRDIENMVTALKEAGPDLGSQIESTTYADANNIQRKQYILDKEMTLTLTSGYSVQQRYTIIKRWLELEEQKAPVMMTPAEVAAASANAIVALERKAAELEQEQRKQVAINDQVSTQIRRLEVDTRNGVPLGFVSKAQAHRIYGRGLSREVFDLALTALEVPVHKYVHTENGHSTHTYAWDEEAIAPAIQTFLDDATQSTQTQCTSAMLSGKRFRFVKEKTLL